MKQILQSLKTGATEVAEGQPVALSSMSRPAMACSYCLSI